MRGKENRFKFLTIFEKKIFRNIFFSFMSSLILFVFMYGALIFPMQKKSLIEVMHSEANTLANSISLVCADAMVSEDDSFIIEHNLAVIEHNPNIFMITVSKSDGLVLEAQKNSWTMPDELDSQMIKFEKSFEVYEIINLNILKTEVFHYTMPIVISGIEWGWIHIDFALDQYNKNISNTYLFLIYITLGSLLVAFFVSYLLSIYILSPILILNDVAKEVSMGNLNTKSNIERDDEIGAFTKVFDLMIENLALSKDKLRRSHENLEKRVLDRTKELEEKSRQLKDLNRTLDQRVKEESQKLRQNEQLLIQQSRQAAMGEMIGNIAHQWRQPLNALGLVLQNMQFEHQMGTLDDDFMNRSVDKGKKLTQIMSKTIDDFRNFFKANKLKEHFKIAEVINNTIDLVEASFKNNSIEIKTKLDKNIEFVGHPSEFSQVVLNILSNAKDALIEHKEKDRVVNIETYLSEKIVTIKISDNAGGIPKGVIEKIFEPYFTTKEEGKGTGIGLYMSKTIIETNMSGKISVENSSDGAVFTILLNSEDQ